MFMHKKGARKLRAKLEATIADEIREQRRAQGAELTAADVGRRFNKLGEFGVVQLGDVGKRVWLRDSGINMENDAQRSARQAIRQGMADALAYASNGKEEYEP